MNTTLPSTFLLRLITDLWSEVPGQIFLLSVLYYLFSVFIVSGYLAHFAGGFGNIGLGDYSLIDFLFFLPTLAVTGLNIVFDNFWRVVGNILLYLITPNFVGLLVASWLFTFPNLMGNLPPFILQLVLYMSVFVWLAGLIVLQSNTSYRWLPFILQLLGILFFSMAAVGVVTNGVKPPTFYVDPIVVGTMALIGNLIFLIMGIGGALLIIILAGISIARGAIKYKYLSRIIRMELTQPLPGLNEWRVAMPKAVQDNFWTLFRAKAAAPMNYRYEPNGAVLIIASLRKVTAFYIDQSDGIFTENGRLFLVSNTNISSLEVRSGKKSD